MARIPVGTLVLYGAFRIRPHIYSESVLKTIGKAVDQNSPQGCPRPVPL
jgi:hypothetical protein